MNSWTTLMDNINFLFMIYNLEVQRSCTDERQFLQIEIWRSGTWHRFEYWILIQFLQRDVRQELSFQYLRKSRAWSGTIHSSIDHSSLSSIRQRKHHPRNCNYHQNEIQTICLCIMRLSISIPLFPWFVNRILIFQHSSPHLTKSTTHQCPRSTVSFNLS